MFYSDLIQAKKENKLVVTPKGIGQINGIGSGFTFIYFQDSPDSVAGKLIEFPNDQIESTEYCPNCWTQVAFETKLQIAGLNNVCVNCGDYTR